jgi:hypothetical protein
VPAYVGIEYRQFVNLQLAPGGRQWQGFEHTKASWQLDAVSICNSRDGGQFASDLAVSRIVSGQAGLVPWR